VTTGKDRFIELLKQDIARFYDVANAWDELEKDAAQLTDINGKIIARAADLAADYRATANELEQLIEKMG
jgi:hypothetical protein